MLNLGGLFGAMGRMLPGYIQGREQAIQSNWNDLNQYNQAQAGQIRNAFGELTFPYAFNMFADRAAIQRASALNAAANWANRYLGMGDEFDRALQRSEYGPLIGEQQARNALQVAQRGPGPDLTQTLTGIMNGANPYGFLTGQWQQQQNTNTALSRQQNPTAAQ